MRSHHVPDGAPGAGVDVTHSSYGVDAFLMCPCVFTAERDGDAKFRACGVGHGCLALGVP